MKYIIEITRDKNSFNISKNCKNDIEQIDYFIDNLLCYNINDVLNDTSNIVELRGDKSHFKSEFIVYEDIIQNMIIDNYSEIIAEVQYKNIKNNSIDKLLNKYDFISRNCYIPNKILVIKYLKAK